MNKPTPAIEDDPAMLHRLAAISGWSPEWLNVVRLLAYNDLRYSWAQQYLRDFTPENARRTERSASAFSAVLK